MGGGCTTSTAKGLSPFDPIGVVGAKPLHATKSQP